MAERQTKISVGKTAGSCSDCYRPNGPGFFDGLAWALETLIDGILWVLQTRKMQIL